MLRCPASRVHKPVVSLYYWSRVLLEKLTVTQLVKKFPAFHGTQSFIIVFTRAHP
jgi:hypothetical protein